MFLNGLYCFVDWFFAEIFYKLLWRYFGLKLEENKSRLIEFGRYAENNRKRRGEKKPETFTFLGFTHYCSHSAKGWFRVKRKTSKKKFAKKCKEIHQLISSIRHWSLKLLTDKLNQVLVGYYHYYGITDNFQTQRAEESVLLAQSQEPEEELFVEAVPRHAQRISAGSTEDICQYLRGIMCIISFAGSPVRESRTLGFVQGYAS